MLSPLKLELQVVVRLWELNLDFRVPNALLVLIGFLSCFRGLCTIGEVGLEWLEMLSMAQHLECLCECGWHAQCAWCNLTEKKAVQPRWQAAVLGPAMQREGGLTQLPHPTSTILFL